MKYKIDSTYVSSARKFATVVTPDEVGPIGPYQSEALYDTHTEALIAGIKYLEIRGVRNINWHAVATCVM